MDKKEFINKVKGLNPSDEVKKYAKECIEDIENDTLGLFTYDIAWKNITELMYM